MIDNNNVSCGLLILVFRLSCDNDHKVIGGRGPTLTDRMANGLGERVICNKR